MHRHRRCRRRRIRLQLKFIALQKWAISCAKRRDSVGRKANNSDIKLRFSLTWNCARPSQNVPSINYYLLISTSTTLTLLVVFLLVPKQLCGRKIKTHKVWTGKKFRAMNLHSQSNDLCKHHSSLHRHRARNPISCFGKCVRFFCECEYMPNFIHSLASSIKMITFFLHSVVAHSIDLKPFHLFRLMQFWTSDRNLFCVLVCEHVCSMFAHFNSTVWSMVKIWISRQQCECKWKPGYMSVNESEREEGKKRVCCWPRMCRVRCAQHFTDQNLCTETKSINFHLVSRLFIERVSEPARSKWYASEWGTLRYMSGNNCGCKMDRRILSESEWVCLRYSYEFRPVCLCYSIHS